MLRGYFNIVFEVSGLYVEISRKYIMPGVNQIDKLGLTQCPDSPNSREAVLRNEDLTKYRDDAIAEIKKLAENVSMPFKFHFIRFTCFRP